MRKRPAPIRGSSQTRITSSWTRVARPDQERDRIAVRQQLDGGVEDREAQHRPDDEADGGQRDVRVRAQQDLVEEDQVDEPERERVLEGDGKRLVALLQRPEEAVDPAADRMDTLP